MLRKHGWVFHAVPLGPLELNCHTHGLTENFNHPDIGTYIPIDPKLLHSIIAGIVNAIQTRGMKFEVGKKYDKILRDYDCTFIAAKEHGRDILRLILPDSNGEVDLDKMDGPNAELYKKQYENLEL